MSPAMEPLWGAQTDLALRHFEIGEQRMPILLMRSLAWVKWAAAEVNGELGRLAPEQARAIADAALQVAAGDWDDQFPLPVWQTGSGTQSHMNLNEVLAELANRSLAAASVPSEPVHPNDHVNLGQSTNDVFPTAMHLAVALQAEHLLWPALEALIDALGAHAQAWATIIKTGRTHLQDATPISLGQEFSGYRAQLLLCRNTLHQALPAIHALAIGGTAVGTGLNTEPDFGPRVAARLAARLGLPLTQADNLYAAMAGHEALVAWHGGLKMLAIALTKIACDLRLMGSGPRAGLGELQLPANEPGSSIMPGKVNPTQIEALTMVCAQVIGHDAAIGFAASQGQFELNAYKPLIILDTLDSLRLLGDAIDSFTRHCVIGLQPDRSRLARGLESSLMLVTALAPHLGYDLSAQIAKTAEARGCSLREAALALQATTAEQFDAWVDPRRMIGPLRTGSA